MTTTSVTHRSLLLPHVTPAAGEVLWGEAPRRQPIAPLVLMALLLVLIAAPSAMGGNGTSSNPITLMRRVADGIYAETKLMEASNQSLANIDAHSKPLVTMQQDMDGIAASTAGMQASTEQLATTLKQVSTNVAGARGQLTTVDEKLAATQTGMGALRANVRGSSTSTAAIVREFAGIDRSITSMNAQLTRAVGAMATSVPLTEEFATNRTRRAIAGGDATKFGVPNYAPNNRVMNIAIPMIRIMQNGGALPARKDRHVASNFLVGSVLKRQVPDGTNVIAHVRPFDGQYGLPGPAFFVANRINGF